MTKKELCVAVVAGDATKVDELIRQFPELLNVIVMGRSNWLSLAAEKSHINVMQVLVSHGHDVSHEQPRVDQPISAAAGVGAFDSVEWLLENGADVNGLPESERPLINAIHSGDLRMVERLIDAGADTTFTWGVLNYSSLSFAESFGASHQHITDVLKRLVT